MQNVRYTAPGELSTPVLKQKKSSKSTINHDVQVKWECHSCNQDKSLIPFLKFAQCSHKLICQRCCKQYLQHSIKNNQNPKCMVESCRANFYTGQESSFELMSDSLKEKWMKKQEQLKFKQPSRFGLIRQCNIPNCKGYLGGTNNPEIQPRCRVCSAEHCPKCFREAHGLKKCPQQSVIVEDLVTCQFCNNQFVKNNGCNKGQCQRCKAEICFNCGKKFTEQHKFCKGTIEEKIFLPFQAIYDFLFK